MISKYNLKDLNQLLKTTAKMMERKGSMRINQIVITKNTIKRSMIKETVTKSLAMLSKLSKTMMRVKTMANMTKRLLMMAKWTMI